MNLVSTNTAVFHIDLKAAYTIKDIDFFRTKIR